LTWSGFSIGSELSLPWLKSTVAEVRRVSRNPPSW
jgi:hypothetical protein